VHDARAHAEARELLARLCESTPGPIYAVTGSPPVDRAEVVPPIFVDLPITWLLDRAEEMRINGHTLHVAGLHCTRERRLDGPRLRRLLETIPRQAFTLLLYHSPDLMPEAVEMGVDLYLCGHTHGGQICLPGGYPLMCNVRAPRRVCRGAWRHKQLQGYTSVGSGASVVEVRLNCPPEITLHDLQRPA